MAISASSCDIFKIDKKIISDLEDDELSDILSTPVHNSEILKRLRDDFLQPSKRTYRRHRKKLPYKYTRRKMHNTK